jgi:hypothetical protein
MVRILNFVSSFHLILFENLFRAAPHGPLKIDPVSPGCWLSTGIWR